jgi:delta8-fatty-acid desaturase
MAFARVNHYVQTVKYLLTHRDARNVWVEAGTLLVFWTWFSLVVMSLPSALDMVLYVALSHVLAGLLHVQITLSHFSMEAIEGVPTALIDPDTGKAQEPDFFSKQLATTLDVNCDPSLDWLHGGLQFQTVHHLFPRLPRHRLRETQQDVIKICDEHGVHYHRVSFWQACKETVDSLYAVGTHAGGFAGFFNDFMNARG